MFFVKRNNAYLFLTIYTFLFSFKFFLSAQESSSDYEKNKRALIYNLELLSSGDYMAFGIDSIYLDPDSIGSTTGIYLTNILKEKIITEKDSIPYLKTIVSSDRRIRVYQYSYHTGGTTGEEFFKYIQLCDSHQVISDVKLYTFYDSSAYYNSSGFWVERIFKLQAPKKNLYLIFSVDQGDLRVAADHYSVIEVDSLNHFNFSPPVFYNKSSYLVHWLNYDEPGWGAREYELDSLKQTLTIKNIRDGNSLGYEEEKKFVSTKRNFMNEVFLFDGQKFVLQNQNKKFDCNRSAAQPIIDKKKYKYHFFELQNDSLTGIEKVELENGDKLTIKNYGCENYSITFSFQTEKFSNSLDSIKYWHMAATTLVKDISDALVDPVCIKSMNDKALKLLKENQIDFTYNFFGKNYEITDLNSLVGDYVVDDVKKLNDKKYQVDITFHYFLNQ